MLFERIPEPWSGVIVARQPRNLSIPEFNEVGDEPLRAEHSDRLGQHFKMTSCSHQPTYRSYWCLSTPPKKVRVLVTPFEQPLAATRAEVVAAELLVPFLVAMDNPAAPLDVSLAKDSLDAAYTPFTARLVRRRGFPRRAPVR